MNTRPSRAAYLVWAVGLVSYIVAVLHRTSLGVTGLEAIERFSASATALSMFVVVQLVVYAALQIPVGLALDRFGSRRLLVAGAILMAAGQLVLALAQSVPLALVGRVLVGAGDATTFACVLRLVVWWFPPQRVPLMTQLTGTLGQFGQLLSAFPLVLLLQLTGWVTTFVSLSAMSVVVGLLVGVLVQDRPGGDQHDDQPDSDALRREPTMREVWRQLVHTWRQPGTRLGLWTHFVTQFPPTIFALMWGYPFLVAGQGLAPGTASAVLMVLPLAGLVMAPVVGDATRRHPLRRSWLVLTVVAGAATSWGVVLVWPGSAPVALLVVLVVVIAAGGPGSMIGFDYARTFNPASNLGTANGIVNIGGFTASLLVIAAIGGTLDLVSGGGELAIDDFRIAMSSQFIVMALGVVGVLRSRRATRAHLAAEGVVVPPIRQAIERNRRMRRSTRSDGEGDDRL